MVLGKIISTKIFSISYTSNIASNTFTFSAPITSEQLIARYLDFRLKNGFKKLRFRYSDNSGISVYSYISNFINFWKTAINIKWIRWIPYCPRKNDRYLWSHCKRYCLKVWYLKLWVIKTASKRKKQKTYQVSEGWIRRENLETICGKENYDGKEKTNIIQVGREFLIIYTEY